MASAGTLTFMLGRATFFAMVPLNVIMTIWAVFGRVIAGIEAGWMLLLLLVTLLPSLLIGLGITSVLAFLQPFTRQQMSTAQALGQWGVWLGLLGFGFFCVDFGDNMGNTTAYERGFLLKILTPTEELGTTSMTIAMFAWLLAFSSWIVLLVAQIGEMRRARAARAAAAQAGTYVR